LYLPGTVTIFITHQLSIRTPFGKVADRLLQRINYSAIGRFSVCWVPDIAGEDGLAGELSHPKRMPPVPTRYIGWLSRMEIMPAPSKKDFEVLVLLSGPEPQRTILEKLIIEQVAGCDCKMVLVRGLPQERTREQSPFEGTGDIRSGSPVGGVEGISADIPEQSEGYERAGQGTPPCEGLSDSVMGGPDRNSGRSLEAPRGVVVYDHLPTGELERLILRSDVVLSRPGYSTVMDLRRIGKKAIFVPTPGQTEQEYLGGYLAGKGLGICMQQHAFSLRTALMQAREIGDRPGVANEVMKGEIGAMLGTARQEVAQERGRY